MGSGRVPNNPIVRAALCAAMAGGPLAPGPEGWRIDPVGRPRFDSGGRGAGTISIYPDVLQGPDGRAAPGAVAVASSVVAGLGPFAADVALAVLACLCAPDTADRTKFPRRDPIAIDADTVLRLLGDQSAGDRRRAQRRRVDAAIASLAALRFDVEDASGYSPIGRRFVSGALSWKGDTLFDAIHQGSDGSGRWLIRFGQWSAWWLNVEGSLWQAALPLGLLRLDRRETRAGALFAKKAGCVMSLLQPAARSPIRRRVVNLLRDIGELPPPEHRSPHWGGRTRDRLDEGLLRLVDMKLFEVGWPDGYAPGDADRSRGWVERWLDGNIEFRSPGAAPAARRRPAASAAPPLQVRLRRSRTRRGMTQAALAAALAISQAQLSRIETGLVEPDPDLAARLARWLDGEQG
ncbi:MAG: helix-turn-helix domain-containing protein [Rhodospirillales bacterium]